LGEETDLVVTGSAALVGQDGRAALKITHMDNTGSLDLTAAYSNETGALTLDLRLQEEADGLVARLLGLPGAPPLSLSIMADDPLSDFSADIDVSTDGQPRLTGNLRIVKEGTLAEDAQDTKFTLQVEGDSRPLFAPQYHSFLGSSQRINVAGTRGVDGRLSIEQARLQSAALALFGRVEIGPDGWLDALDLTGRIGSETEESILLLLTGPETRIKGAILDVAFDADRSDLWSMDGSLTGVQRDSVSIGALTLTGSGDITQEKGTVTGTVGFRADQIKQADPALDAAVGARLNGTVTFDWQDTWPLRLTQAEITGKSYSVTGRADITRPPGELDVLVDLDASVQASDLTQFAALAGQDLSGAAELDLLGFVKPISAAFDLKIDGRATDLTVGVKPVDPFLAGTARVSLDAARDETGVTLRLLQLSSDKVDAEIIGTASSALSTLHYTLNVDDFEALWPDADQPVTARGTVTQREATWTIDTRVTGPGGLDTRLSGTADVTEDFEVLPATASAKLSVKDIGLYAPLVGRPVDGAFALDATLTGDNTGAFAVQLDGQAQDLGTGVPELDLLLKGASALSLATRHSQSDRFVIDRAELRTSALTADATGRVAPNDIRLRYALDLQDMGLFLPGLNGAVTSEGTVAKSTGPYTVDARLNGPSGTFATIAGDIRETGAQADLSIKGAVPLGLANRFAHPNLIGGMASFDLRVNGPFAPDAISGTLQTRDAQVTVPALRQSFDRIVSTVTLGNGTARLQATAQPRDGGRVNLTGSLGISAPYQGQLDVGLSDLTVSEPGLYETQVTGAVTVQGALAQNASISGDIALGTTELRIPDGAGATALDLLEITHLGESPASFRTRDRAGLTAVAQSEGAGIALPIELQVTAPSRIFVRGRGLDAEFGGGLALQGTTQNLQTDGRFDLIRGRLDILGRRLALSEASLRLRGDFDPFVRAVASTVADDVTIQIVLEGLASAPSVSFTSAPDLPEEEILARLLFGRNLGQLSALQAVQLASAVRTLAGRGGEGVVSRLRSTFGLDDLDISSSETGGVGVRLGAYLNDNTYTDVTVDSTGESEINLNLTLSPSTLLRGSATSDGETGFGIFFEREY
jgi:translocation and assembly module TamB